jgi:hypothetical protein
VGVAVASLAVAVAAGWAEQVHYLDHRYEDTYTAWDMDGPLRWARDVRDANIAVGGIRGVFTQYGLYGTDLSNHVQWLGRVGAHDTFQRIGTCEEWRRAIDDGGYTHVVTAFDQYASHAKNTPEGRWTGSDPNAKVILREGPVRVFQIMGPLDPSGCQGQKPLPEARLHGVPNLNGAVGG